MTDTASAPKTPSSLRNPGFTHLHLHTQYSLLDGAIRMDELCPTIKEQMSPEETT